LALETKKIPYRVEKINMSCYGRKPSTFLQIQPGGQIPVATIKGRTYGQSNDILDALEREFPNHGPALMPPSQDVPATMQARELFALERRLFGAWMGWLTGRGGSRGDFERVLREVDSALIRSDGPFFLGRHMSMVDVQFAPFLERMAASMLYFKGFKMRWSRDDRSLSNNTADDPSLKYAAINAWFDAMEELPAYQLTKSDYYTHCWDLPPQLGGCTSEPAGKPYRDAIDGVPVVRRSGDGSATTTSSSWQLPLQRHNGGVEPDWDWAAPDDAAARREAVERVTANHEAIVKFACRGA
jgi:glutathione S-transferase